MKKKYFILGTILFTALSVSAMDLTTENISSPEYLINHGHSKIMTETVTKSKLRANGESPERKNFFTMVVTAPINLINNVFRYLDPAMEQDQFMNHDIKFYPVPTDL